jgi:hypothetical protein
MLVLLSVHVIEQVPSGGDRKGETWEYRNTGERINKKWVASSFQSQEIKGRQTAKTYETSHPNPKVKLDRDLMQ